MITINKTKSVIEGNGSIVLAEMLCALDAFQDIINNNKDFFETYDVTDILSLVELRKKFEGLEDGTSDESTTGQAVQ